LVGCNTRSLVTPSAACLRACRLKAETTRFDSPTQAWLDLVFGVVMTGVVLRMLDSV
jgi:hypothetical protein